ncbi:MAG: AmmeMemoRadiSam system protein B [Candidatus Omnitrophota bacterium]
MLKKKILFFFLLLSFFFTTMLFSQTKEPEFSGTFYPEGIALVNLLNELTSGSGQVNNNYGNIIGAVVPHAAYRYSGAVAGIVYSVLKNIDIETIILLAPSHKYYFKGIAVYPSGNFLTPLGPVILDDRLCKEIMSLDFAVGSTEYFDHEHAIEVQLPFLKKIYPQVKIVPVLFGDVSYQQILELSRYLASLSKKRNFLLLISTDLSHYLPYEKAVEYDKNTISLVTGKNAQELWRTRDILGPRACGLSALVVLLEYSKLRNADIRLLKYLNSGDTGDYKDKVVGYMGAVSVTPLKEEGDMNKFELTNSEKKLLLKIARVSVESAVNGRAAEEITAGITDSLKFETGAFVTLTQDGALRGCIGNIISQKPLYKLVGEMAAAAALDDNRFLPVVSDEVAELEFEISVLSPITKVEDISQITVGRDGLIIRKGIHSGLLLPQVATEYGWTVDEFLANTCIKAGINRDEYKNKGVEIYKFSAIVFNESDFKE